MLVSIRSIRWQMQSIFESVEAIDSIAVTVVVEQVRGTSEENFGLFVTHPLPPMNG